MLKKILILMFASILLFSCSVKKQENSKINYNINTNNKYFIIVPHHDITHQNIDNFYKNLSKKYKNIKNIVIISPNHYWEGSQFMESFRYKWTYCFNKDTKENCIKWGKLSFYNYKKWFIKDLADYKNPIWKNKYLIFEHGIWEHFSFINKYFKNYNKIYPVILKIEHKNFNRTKNILEQLKKYNFPKWNTLFIASVDFSHHNPEEFAVFHDLKSVEELNKNIFKTAEVDCPNCLFLEKNLASLNSKNIFKLFNRTSSSNLMNKKLKYENTTHVFGEFISWNNNLKEEIKKQNIWFFDKLKEYKILKFDDKINSWTGAIYFIFFGDTHLTRSFTYNKKYKNIPKSYEDKRNYLKCFYQNKDINKNPNFWINRIFYSFDFVWVNLETAVCEKKFTIQSEKIVKLLTNPKYLYYFKSVWINTFNLSNNHSYDYWNTCYKREKEILKEKWFYYFWEWRKTESEILKLKKNWLKIAFIWINTTTYSWKLQDKLNKIKELKKQNYKIILNLHSWLEYHTTNSKYQQQIAHKFIDTWVDIIIWHHPHVVQNYEIYKNKPIFYSLWNFIFDQGFDDTLKWRTVFFRLDNNSIRYNFVDFKRNNKDFSVECDSL